LRERGDLPEKKKTLRWIKVQAQSKRKNKDSLKGKRVESGKPRLLVAQSSINGSKEKKQTDIYPYWGGRIIRETVYSQRSV